jgi:ABC-2 type transport system permease protein
MRLAWLNFRRDRVALMLSFALPIVFFSIFASIFAPRSGGEHQAGSSKLRIIAVDEDHSKLSQRLLRQLATISDVELVTEFKNGDQANPSPHDRQTAWQAVRQGQAPIAIVVLPHFREALSSIFSPDKQAAVELLFDPSDPMALPAVQGMLQASIFQLAPELLADAGFRTMGEMGAPATPEQLQMLEKLRRMSEDDESSSRAGAESGEANALKPFLPIKTTDVHASPTRSSGSNTVAYYAAGISVMFLLFSLTSAAGSILEEDEFGTLDRLLCTRLTMRQLLLGKGCFYAAIGWLQIMVMFVWANLAFNMPFWTPLTVFGSSLVALFTSATAAAFGLFLASISRTRAQLSGLSTIIILTLSAIGGSMVPKMFMPPLMQTLGKFTFNGQALDAFLQVFWHFDPSMTTWQNLLPVLPHLAALVIFCTVFLLLALRFARRWESL